MSKHTDTSLRNLTSSLEGMVDTCFSTNKAATVTSVLASAGSEVDSVLEQLKKFPKTYSKTKKSLIVLRNTISGMHDGVIGHDLSIRELRAVCSNVKDKFLVRLATSIETDMERLPKTEEATAEDSLMAELPPDLREIRSVVLSGGSLQEMLQTVRRQLADANNQAAKAPTSVEVDAEEDPDPVGTKRNATLTSYYEKEKQNGIKELVALNKFREAMPSSLKSHNSDHSFTMVRMPIVPLFDQWNVTPGNFLKKLGIPHIPLSGYMIFQDQLLLIVSKSSAMKASQGIKKRASSKPATEKKMRMLDFNREAQKVTDYANVILSIINEKSQSNTYSIVSDKFVSNPKNQDLVCFWVMGTKKLSALIRAVGFGSSKVKSWGFPWVDTAHPAADELGKGTFVHPSDNPNHPHYLEYDKNKGKRPEGWKSSDVPYRRHIS